MKEKPYTLVKAAICNISDTYCTEQACDWNSRVVPDCKNCYIFQDWKKTGLSFEEYREQEGNELNGHPHYSEDDTVIRIGNQYGKIQ